MRHLIDPLDFTLEETLKILNLADRISENPSAYSHVADGKSSQRSSMNQAQGLVFLLRQRC